MKKMILLLAVIMLLSASLSGCGLSTVLSSDVVKTYYTDDDYHFEMSYPSSFSGPEMTYLDEDENEVEYKFTNGDEQIKLTCLFNTEDSFYDYITEGGFDKKYIEFKNAYSFLYDKTETPTPEYKHIMATKKMVYTLDYTAPDMTSHTAVDSMSMIDIDFTYYANVPKDNATLSEPISLADERLSVRVPADCEYTLTPILDPVPYKTVTVEVEEVIGIVEKDILVVDTDKYSGILIKNNEYLCAFRAPSDAPYTYEQINAQTAQTFNTDRASAMLSGEAVNLSLTSPSEFRVNNGSKYLISNISCTVGDNKYRGTYSVGYTEGGVCFEYVYVSGVLSEGEEEQLTDIIYSAIYE